MKNIKYTFKLIIVGIMLATQTGCLAQALPILARGAMQVAVSAMQTDVRESRKRANNSNRKPSDSGATTTSTSKGADHGNL